MKKYFLPMLGVLLIAALFSACVKNMPQAENKLAAEWTEGYIDQVLQKRKDVDGTDYISASGIHTEWASPFLPAYEAMKAAVGEKAKNRVVVKFEARVLYKGEANGPITVHPILRGEPVKEELRDIEFFNELYDGELFDNRNGNLLVYFTEKMELTGEWSAYEGVLPVAAAEFDDALWREWYLCVDSISDPKSIEALEFKNVGVYDSTDLLYPDGK